MRVLVILDPLGSLKWNKDSSLCLIRAMQKEAWDIHLCSPADLWLQDFSPYAKTQGLHSLGDDATKCQLDSSTTTHLSTFDIIFVRQDPPVDDHYLFITHVLEQAENQGTLVINKPQALRDANEKLFSAWFKAFTAPSLISQNTDLIKQFIHEQKTTVLKPLNQMGGKGIVKIADHDPNTASLIDILTHGGTTPIMAQKFLPEITQGDRRILLIHGEPIPYVLIRKPHPSDFRGNMAAGGSTTIGQLTKQEQTICTELKPILQAKGLFLVGLDIIGDSITEINVTSPTGISQIESEHPESVTTPLIKALKKLAHKATS